MNAKIQQKKEMPFLAQAVLAVLFVLTVGVSVVVYYKVYPEKLLSLDKKEQIHIVISN